MDQVFTKKVFSAVLGFCFVLNVSADFLLYKNKQPQAVILVKNKAQMRKLKNCIVRFGDELKKHGVKALPVVSGKAPAGKNMIELVIKNEPVPLKMFDFVIDFPAKNKMLITGNCVSAVSFAFNHILDTYAKRRIYLARSKVVKGELNDYPPIRDLAIPRKRFADGPDFPIRFTAGKIGNWNSNCMYWGTHFLGAFTFPVTKYYDNNSWPEAIMPTLANGQKFKMPAPKKKLREIFRGRYRSEGHYARLTAGAFNPCYSAKATEDIAVENLLESIKRRPDLKSFVIDIADCGQCKCKTCLKLVGNKRTITGHMNYSDIYWKWVKNVAERVNKKHPHIMFMGLAYREMLSAPSFKLPKTVISGLCFELAQMDDPQPAAMRREIMEGWRKKCSNLTMYGYGHGGLDSYYLPRIYSQLHGKILKEFHSKYNLRGYHHETYVPVSTINGPENYVVGQLLWDIKKDVNVILKEWYEGMVGRKAAPYLQEFCEFWEKYWTGKEIRKTPWYQSGKSIYYSLGEHSHIFALKKGDMAYCRKLINKILANAQTPAQKRRAQLLSREFETSELAAKALFAELIQSNGSIADVKTAREIIRSLPEASKAVQKFFAHPSIKTNRKDGLKRIESFQLLAFTTVLPYLSDPETAKLFASMKDVKELSFTMKACIRYFAPDNGMKNLYPNSSFEDPKKTARLFRRYKKPQVEHTTKIARSGKYSMKLSNGNYAFRVDAKPGEKFLVVAWIYTNKPSAEGKFSYRLGPCHFHKKTGRPFFLRWYAVDNIKVPAGQWLPLVISGEVPLLQTRGGGKGNSIFLYLYPRRFEDDEFIYLDDVSFVKL